MLRRGVESQDSRLRVRRSAGCNTVSDAASQSIGDPERFLDRFKVKRFHSILLQESAYIRA